MGLGQHWREDTDEQVTAGAAAHLREGMGALKGGVSEMRDGLVLPTGTYHLPSWICGKGLRAMLSVDPVIFFILLFERVIILVRMCMQGRRRLVSQDMCTRMREGIESRRVYARVREGSMNPDFLL